MNNNQEIFAYGDSVVSILPAGVTKAQWPTTWSQALPVGTQVLGFTSTDGETFTRTVETTDIDANQQAKVRQIASSGSATLEFTSMEDNEVSRWLYSAVQAPVSGEYTDVEDLTATVTRVLVYDTSDTQEGFIKHKRYVFLANIIPNGGITYARGGVANRPFMATALGGYREITSEVNDVIPEEGE